MRVRRAVFGAADHLTFYQKCKKKWSKLSYYFIIYQYLFSMTPKQILERELFQSINSFRLGSFRLGFPLPLGLLLSSSKTLPLPQDTQGFSWGMGRNHLLGVGIRAPWNNPRRTQAPYTEKRGVHRVPACHIPAGGGCGVAILLFLGLSSPICETNKRLSQTAVVRQMKMYIRYLANGTLSISITENIIILITRQPLLGQGWVTRKQGLQERGCPRSRRRLFLALILSPLSFSQVNLGRASTEVMIQEQFHHPSLSPTIKI